MRIAVLGGGPAGLYFAYLWKRRHPHTDISLYEQNPPDATWGFGVVFSERALEFLRVDDPETADLIALHLEDWRDMTLDLRGEQVVLDGIGFSAIGRLKLLELLQQRVYSVGIKPKFRTPIQSPQELGDVDLIVGADGLNSIVRRSFASEFGSSLYFASNKFVWYGTSKRFETLTQTFVDTGLGCFNAHHYRYAADMSTFLIECDEQTWLSYDFATKPGDESKAICEQVFSHTLGGHPLLSNNSVWRNFPWVWNKRWYVRNMVLVGDALHTAHFSIGSGTRLAIEDVLALVKALEAENDISRGLARYQAERRPIVETFVEAAKASADWYENFAAHMRLDPLRFAYSYITRSGRIDDARLRKMSPAFMARFEALRSNAT
jgi:2-polyprenyl-6-methoxyphenol hydroxylase-like FAD-dependent oxidoreductase